MKYFHSSVRKGLVVLVAALLWGCNGGMRTQEREAPGGRYYGGVFNANEAEELRSLFPLSLTQAASQRIAAQIFEGLVSFDQRDLSIRPALATRWTVDPSSSIYTFTLRRDASFHDDACFPSGKGRAFTSEDVVHAFTQLCTASGINQMSWLFLGRVAGAEEHFAASMKGPVQGGVRGVEAVDGHTVRITLTGPSPNFLQVLAHQGCWIYPRELVEKYGADAHWHPVGTGAFRMRSFRRGEALILERNPSYWAEDEHGNRLPYLDAIRYTFANDKNRELEEFEKGHLSVIYELPVERTDFLQQAHGRFQVQSIPAYSVQFYGFNHRLAPFNDIRVRRAFSMAIDRQLLVDSILDGFVVPATRGVVPPGFQGYPYDSVPPLIHDPAAARALLAQAGYPQGKGLPAIHLQVNNDGFGYVQVASMVQIMLEEELGARVVTTVLPVKQHFERIERGEALFWREGWIVDHPDPENVLALFHGRSVPTDSSGSSFLNSTRYVNAVFDAAFGAAQGTIAHQDRMRLLARAERQLMQDAVVVPLYHERSIRLLQPHVRDLPINSMEYRDLRWVWFDPTVLVAQ
jgi:oligopeptide transport system substrate-binding protein